MKIAQIMLTKGFGGAERAFVDTCLGLAQAGNEVLAIIHPDFIKRETLRQHGIRIFPLRFFATWDPYARSALAHALEDFQPDVVHVHLRRGMELAASRIKKMGLPLVATLHNYNGMKKYIGVDRLIALTGDHKTAILAAVPTLAGRVDVIANFSRFAPYASAMPDSGPLKLLAYGRFVRKKGFDLLLDAFSKAKAAAPELTLTLAGDGEERSNLEMLIKRLGLGSACELRGWTDQVESLLDEHDVFVLPSRSEPFGIVVLEAMARGKAIISSRSEGPSQFLDESVSLLFDVGDADQLASKMIFANTDRRLMQKLADQALARYRDNYHVDRVIPRILATYRKAMAK